jgi:hypothetical protein
MIRTTPEQTYKGLKRTPIKRTPLKRKPPKKIAFLTKTPPKKQSVLKIRIDPLDALFSTYIRTRDTFTCQRCGVKSKNVQCAHFNGRGRKSVRWDEDNACTLDMGCHLFLDSQPLDKTEFFRQRLGQERFDMLLGRMRQTYPRPDKKMLTIYYQQQIKLLDPK